MSDTKRKRAESPSEEEEKEEGTVPFTEGEDVEEEEEGGDDGLPSSDEDEDEEEGSDDEGDEEGEHEDDEQGNYGLDDDEEEEGDEPAEKPKSFLAGEKGESFARAFAKLIGRASGIEPPAKRSKKGEEEGEEGEGGSGSEGEEERSEGEAGPSAVPLKAIHSGPILAGSKTLLARQRSVAKDAKAEKESRRLKAALKKRGHKPVPRKGVDPEMDAAEKALQRIATKGVVRLFNAVTKAQKAQREAEALGQENAKLSKASFFADLKGETQGKRASAGATKPSGGAPGWDVLGGSIQGLTSGTRMKDWDKDVEEEEEDGLEEPGGRRGIDEGADYELSDSEDSEEGEDDDEEDEDDDIGSEGEEEDEDEDEGAW